MLGGLWDSATGKLADRFFASSSQALVFWVGGLLAWAIAHGGLRGLDVPERHLARYTTPGQLAVLAAALSLVAASAIVVRRLTFPVLRLLEGYWPWPAGPLRDQLIAAGERRAEAARREIQQLAGPVNGGTATRGQRDRYVRLDLRLRRQPTAARLLPTPIGNTLRAAESRPADKYGLDPVSLWPHLWLLMPDTARQELASARGALDASVSAVVWSLLFTAFAIWSPWAVAAGLGMAALTLLVWVPARAAAFATLVETAFDLYREDLYTRLRWPLPATPHAERSEGRRVTAYLLRGSDADTPVFTSPSSAGDDPARSADAGPKARSPGSGSPGSRDQPG
jgi:hypothetical protein